MSAIKKPDHHEPETYETPATDTDTAGLEEVSARPDVEAAESPARAMQENLARSMEAHHRRERIKDIGRVLASASGITTLLGIFFLYGIW